MLLPWLEARICRGLGELAAAERGLAAVWHAFRKAGFPRELTLVSLDLAEVYLAQGWRRSGAPIEWSGSSRRRTTSIFSSRSIALTALPTSW